MNYPTNLLVIDDDRDDHEIFQETLQLINPNVKCYFAFTCPEAVELITSKSIPVPGYIFLDWNLPGVQGMNCVEQLRQVIRTTVKLFILTGGNSPADSTLLNSPLVNGILYKQSSLDQLAKDLSNVLRQ